MPQRSHKVGQRAAVAAALCRLLLAQQGQPHAAEQQVVAVAEGIRKGKGRMGMVAWTKLSEHRHGIVVQLSGCLAAAVAHSPGVAEVCPVDVWLNVGYVVCEILGHYVES